MSRNNNNEKFADLVVFYCTHLLSCPIKLPPFLDFEMFFLWQLTIRADFLFNHTRQGEIETCTAVGWQAACEEKAHLFRRDFGWLLDLNFLALAGCMSYDNTRSRCESSLRWSSPVALLRFAQQSWFALTCVWYSPQQSGTLRPNPRGESADFNSISSAPCGPPLFFSSRDENFGEF